MKYQAPQTEFSENSKSKNKVYYRGEHKGERRISDQEFQNHIERWKQKGEWKKIDFLIKLDKIYASRNQLHCLSNLERLERIRNVFGD